MLQTISLLVENKPGALMRITGVLSARGYNIEVWDGDSWATVVSYGQTVQSIQLSGFGLRILNDTYYTITVDYVFVYNSAP